jgi:hypothetical protein
MEVFYSFKSLFIEVLQGYSAPYSATSIYNTYILSIQFYTLGKNKLSQVTTNTFYGTYIKLFWRLKFLRYEDVF